MLTRPSTDLFSEAANNSKVAMLNDDQRAIHTECIPLINANNGAIIRLIGYAGTGKTFLTTCIINSTNPKLRYGMTAPTHKAVRVLRKSCENPENYVFGTIHSLLGLEQKIDRATGAVSYVSSFDSKKDIKIKQVDVLLVDEVSMLDTVLFNKLMEYHAHRPITMVFIGDSFQIPPVGFASSPVFEKAIVEKYNMHCFELSRIMRQGEGSEIIQYATYIRQNYQALHMSGFKMPESSHLKLLDRNYNGTFPILNDLFTSDEFKEDTDFAKVIAYRNDTCKFFNTAIRKMIFKDEDLPKVVVGDQLVASSAILAPRVSLTKPQDILAQNSEEMEVLGVRELEDEYMYRKLGSGYNLDEHYVSIASYQCRVEIPDIQSSRFRTQYINVLHEKDEIRVATIVEQLRVNALKAPIEIRGQLWREYYNFQNYFADVTHNYAITGHKSQGSSYTHCIAQEWDMDTNRNLIEKNKIKYVAATRPRETLYLVR